MATAARVSAKAALADYEATVARLRSRIAGLEAGRNALLVEIGSLEEEVARLEAEDLQPLVDRLRVQIRRIQQMLQDMADEVSDEE